MMSATQRLAFGCLVWMAAIVGGVWVLQDVEAKPKASKAPEGMVEVPAGEFWMGCDPAKDSPCEADEAPKRKVTLDAFYIDTTEVTVEAYIACATAGACSPPSTTKPCDTAANNWGKADRTKHPINCVTWDQADAFCKWAGKQLPTEAQWEKAARGKDGKKYPWGDKAASCTHAVMDDKGKGCGTDQTLAVGSKPKGKSAYGALDMSGNVWEWTADRYERDLSTAPTTNPTGSADSKTRVSKGGGFDSSGEVKLRASDRLYSMPDYVMDTRGFRCAKPATP
jgi:sulfatase modifying factor 1